MYTMLTHLDDVLLKARANGLESPKFWDMQHPFDVATLL